MKKLLLTAAVAFCTLVASAQFMVVTNYDNDQEDNMDKITANMGVGFMVNDAFTIGMAKGSLDGDGNDTYDMWARYNLPGVDGGYASLTMPSSDGDDDGMRIGVGFSFNVWNGLYIEPNYTMNASNDDDREGNFNFGLSYRF
tara:strand:- start:69 stop:494 length:426 start_codon:yes stop_codon:yes gene_type:complete